MTASPWMEWRKGPSRLWRLFVAMLGMMLLALPITPARAQLSVLPGWDLFTTAPGTSFNGVPFVGVPLGTFDFGGAIGVETVWDTDTIVQRLAPAVVPGPVVPPSQTAPPIPIEMVALQLVSQVPVDLGAGLGFYFVTLQSARGGPASVGTMTITFDNMLVPPPAQPQNGTFDSLINVLFDVRFGALNGPIVLSDSVVVSDTGTGWSHFPSPAALLIEGVNHNLNGVNELGDFHVIGTLHDGGPHPVIQSFVSPEPGSIGLLMLGLGLVGARMIRRRG